jgi:hypothetical protein
MKWLLAEDEILIAYCKAGKSQSDAWHEHFTTRTYSSVVGRCDRLGLKFVGRRDGRKNLVSAAHIQKPKTIKPLPIIDDSHLPSINLAEARDEHCRWIIGDARAKRTCASFAVRGCSYCALHAQMVFATVKPAPSNGVVA